MSSVGREVDHTEEPGGGRLHCGTVNSTGPPGACGHRGHREVGLGCCVRARGQRGHGEVVLGCLCGTSRCSGGPRWSAIETHCCT